MSDHRTCEQLLPDFGASSAAIDSVKRAPVSMRLDYSFARGEALAATDTPNFPAALNEALDAKERVYRALTERNP
jgi:hypothetical protein